MAQNEGALIQTSVSPIGTLLKNPFDALTALLWHGFTRGGPDRLGVFCASFFAGGASAAGALRDMSRTVTNLLPNFNDECPSRMPIPHFLGTVGSLELESGTIPPEPTAIDTRMKSMHLATEIS